MKFLTLSTTGIFNAIRPSLFLPIEGKETTTFLLALTFHTPEITFLGDEPEDVESGEAEYALERQRIRSFVKALCNENGKPIEELRTECINRLPEFIRYGTYNGEDLLDTPRTGTYELYSMYKSYQGQRLLFKKNRPPKDEAQYIYDHMLRYFMTTLFSPDGILGYLCGAYHVDTPLSATAKAKCVHLSLGLFTMALGSHHSGSFGPSFCQCAIEPLSQCSLPPFTLRY